MNRAYARAVTTAALIGIVATTSAARAEGSAVAEYAMEHCQPAVTNASTYDADVSDDVEEVARCEVWIVLNAGEPELELLGCLAGATSEQAWAACGLTTTETDLLWHRAAPESAEATVSRVQMKKRELDRQIAENAGVLEALRDGSELEGIFGSSGLDSDLVDAIGGLVGAQYGEDYGTGGLGSRGSGLGGGGTAEGLGGLGTKGRGTGASGYGVSGGYFGSSSTEGQFVEMGDPIILGALDREAMDWVVKRHLNQVRYCYQRELNKTPDIQGKVVVKVEVAGDGTVTSAEIKSTTLKNEQVENCLLGRFMRFQFPEIKGGGIVIASYPFIFTSGE